MPVVRLSKISYWDLFLAPGECMEFIGVPFPPPGMPPEAPVRRLQDNIDAGTRLSDGSYEFVVADEDVEVLVALIPSVMLAHGDDIAEMAAVMNAWPEDLERVQAELLAALRRSAGSD